MRQIWFNVGLILNSFCVFVVYPGEIAMLEVKDSPVLKSGLPLWIKDPVHPETILDVLSFQVRTSEV